MPSHAEKKKITKTIIAFQTLASIPGSTSSEDGPGIDCCATRNLGLWITSYMLSINESTAGADASVEALKLYTTLSAALQLFSHSCSYQ